MDETVRRATLGFTVDSVSEHSWLTILKSLLTHLMEPCRNFSNHHGDLTTLTKAQKDIVISVISCALNTDSVRQEKNNPQFRIIM